MTAKTKWWYCGKCGFANHPRPAAAPVYRAREDGLFELVTGEQNCEQCGSPASDAAAIDYAPRGS